MTRQMFDDHEFLTSTARPSYEDGNDEITLVDLFSGCGGMALGIAHAAHLKGCAVRIPLAIDNDEGAVKVFRDNFPKAECVPDDVCDWFDPAFDASSSPVEQKTRARLGADIDFLAASTASKHPTTDR